MNQEGDNTQNKADDQASSLPAADVFSNKKKGNGWLKGCGIGCLSLFVLVVALGVYAGYWVSSTAESVRERYKDMGAEVVQKEDIYRPEILEGKALFVGNVVELEGGAKDLVGILGNAVRLKGSFKTVEAHAMMVVLEEGSTIENLQGHMIALINLGEIKKNEAWMYHTQTEMPADARQAQKKYFRGGGESEADPAADAPADQSDKNAEQSPDAGKPAAGGQE